MRGALIHEGFEGGCVGPRREEGLVQRGRRGALFEGEVSRVLRAFPSSGAARGARALRPWRAGVRGKLDEQGLGGVRDGGRTSGADRAEADVGEGHVRGGGRLLDLGRHS